MKLKLRLRLVNQSEEWSTLFIVGTAEQNKLERVICVFSTHHNFPTYLDTSSFQSVHYRPGVIHACIYHQKPLLRPTWHLQEHNFQKMEELFKIFAHEFLVEMNKLAKLTTLIQHDLGIPLIEN